MELKYVFLFLLGVLSVNSLSHGSFLSWGRDRIFFNSRFCKGNLGRIVSATLKERVYKGCLTAGLTKLDSPNSRLHKSFAYEYNPKGVLDKPMIAKGTKGYSRRTRDILKYAILRRMGQSVSDFDTAFAVTDKGKDLLALDLNTFCSKYNGRSTLLAGGSGNYSKIKSTDSLIRLHIQQVNAFELLPEFQRFLAIVSKGKSRRDPDHKRMISKLKTLKVHFFKNMNSLVVLQQRLGQNGTDGEAKKAVVEEALDNLLVFAKHYEVFKQALDTLPKDQKPQFKNLDFFMQIGQYLYKLNRYCHPPKR